MDVFDNLPHQAIRLACDATNDQHNQPNTVPSPVPTQDRKNAQHVIWQSLNDTISISTIKYEKQGTEEIMI